MREYEDLIDLRNDGEYVYGTEKVPFRIMRKIFREAEKERRRTLTYSELKTENNRGV